MPPKYKLGSVSSSEQLIRDLYIDLRNRIRSWATVTHQTAQARMGYVGQHLVSVVTGYPGGRSGARGKDLLLPKNRYAEIKTCYRVDQLGKCLDCEAAVASIEPHCHACRSSNIKRNDDSKWLISIHHDDEYAQILDPAYYYLVLFDFLDMETRDTIRASIWRLDPRVPGFAYCMVDYYSNIRAQSTSKAPFNLWPYQLKFDLMRPLLIYRSLIKSDDTITTLLFPGRDEAEPTPLKHLASYGHSSNLTREKALALATRFGVAVHPGLSKVDILNATQEAVDSAKTKPDILADKLAATLYLPDIKKVFRHLPRKLKEKLP